MSDRDDNNDFEDLDLTARDIRLLNTATHQDFVDATDATVHDVEDMECVVESEYNNEATLEMDYATVCESPPKSCPPAVNPVKPQLTQDLKKRKSSHNAPCSLDYDESFLTASPIPEAEGPHRSPPPSPGLLFESDDLFPPEYFWNYVSDSTEDQSAASAECFDLLIRTEENEDGEEEDKNEELEITEGLEEGAENFEITDKTSLYAGAQINVMESVTSVLSFVQSEHISGVGLSRLLSLINLHLPQPNNFLKTNHMLFKVLEGVDEPVHMHHYCSVCYKIRQSPTDLCDTCTDVNRSVLYFLTFPVAPQLQKMYQRPDFMQNLQYKKTRVKKNVNNIEDIFDGEVYKGAEARMMNENGITFTLNTDGVQIFKSNSYSLWPIYLVINELPPEKRFLSENLIIVGLWGSLQKPHPNLYLLPIYNELAPLKTGVEILVYGEEKPQQICARITCSTCDAPATSQFMNMKSHSGFYSCPVCIIKGVKPGDSVVFPYEANVPLRSLEQYADNVKLAVQNKIILLSTVRNEHLYLGIRGPTILSSLLDNMLSSVAIDSMHCLYLGQMKQMLRLWFDDDLKKQPFSVFHKLAIVSQRIMDLAPPHFLQRLPQVLEKLVHWKASEFRSFLFYFSAILLRDVLKPDYFDHFLLFVQGVSLLNSSSISEEDLVLASSLLEQFVEKFEQLYGVNYMTHNLHMCMHLARCVKLLGPLWAYSCFQFEDINGRLTNFIHGTRHISLQIHSNLAVITQLPLMVNKLDEGVAKEYCKTIKRKYRMKISGVITPGVYCVGPIVPINLDTVWVFGFLKNKGFDVSSKNIELFQRLVKYSLLYMSKSYNRGKRISSYCKYKIDDSFKYGNITCFVKVSCKCSDSCSCSINYFVLVKPVPVEPFHVRHIFQFTDGNVAESFFSTDVICVEDLETVMFMVECSGKKYLAEPLNKFEME